MSNIQEMSNAMMLKQNLQIHSGKTAVVFMMLINVIDLKRPLLIERN